MSVVYRSWEVASGPTMGYNMSIQGNMCAIADTLVPEASNCSSNMLLSPESFMKAVVAGSDVSKGLTFPNHKTHSPQDTVIRGFSSLPLHSQLELQARSPSEDCKLSCELSNKSLESNCNNLLESKQRNINCFAARLAGNHTQGRVSGSQKSMHHDWSGFHSFEGALGGSALLSHSGSLVWKGSSSLNTCRVATGNFLPLHDDYGGFESYDCTNAYHRPKHTLDVVVEDKPFEENSIVAVNDDLELDAVLTSSTNSVSSLHEPVDGSVSSGEGLHGVGESEVKSAYKGSSTFTGGCFPPRKGLSRFYAGKSRSFSCLGDVMSLRDLAKPENPYAKKRRCHVGRSVIAGCPQLPPLPKGVASISKKAVHNGKSTLALAVAMSTREVVIDVEKDDQSFLGSWLRTSRSYSLSDLQRATENQVSTS